MLMILSAGLISADLPQDGFIREYRIGPKDLLEIKVQEVPELSSLGVRVSEDGSITLPLAGNIGLAGMTKDEVEKLIARVLIERNLVKNPQVSVFIKEYQSQVVSLIGAVTKPGIYQLVGRVTLLDIISQAGGFKESASNEIFVLREGQGGAAATMRIDLEDLTVNGNPKLNIPLQPGDVINIPADEVISIFVFGAVRSPGALQVKKSSRINIVQAIAQAGGLTESGKYSGITIKRTLKDGREENLKVNLMDIIRGKKPNIVLLKGDVVFVRESIW
ncbi:MAG: polysaccharide export protein [Acidobacteriota bacterium]|nr:polysaccharide export protein [Acidobacteriota bacterium]MDW3228021.1 polysaccharide export protein [Acidobacteriota bacterium]HNT33105.1 polysaccharide biosynthesis/export family protein [Candidatus Aminicenantes bacterium]